MAPSSLRFGATSQLSTLACMSAPPFSKTELAEYVQIIGFGQMDNVTLNPAHSHPDVPAAEAVVMEVIDRDGRGLFFTGSGFTIPGHGFVPYKDIFGADWARCGLTTADKKKIEISFTNRPLVVTLNLGDGATRLGLFIHAMAMKHRRHPREL